MSLKIAVCDDCDADRTYLSDLVRQWAGGTEVQVRTFPSATAFLFQYAQEKDFDVLLLDIEMEGLDGVTLAKQLRQDNQWVQIVFVTGYADYIAEGYEVSALHYLMKPIRPEKLCSVLDRAVEKCRKNERTLTLELSGELVLLPFREIRWAEVRQNYVTIHGKRDYTVKMPLGELEAQLDERFFRAGRSFLLNLSYIQRVTKQEVYLSDGAAIPLPRGVYEPLNRAIISKL